MVLNRIWIGFFLIAILVTSIKAVLTADIAVFFTLQEAAFDAAKTAFDICLKLTGVMAFWLGFLAIAEQAGLIQALARAVSPFFNKLFPDLGADHPAMGAIMMNFSANMLGLDNAATPLGLKAMQAMDTVNPEKGTATNSMIMFLAINTAGLTLIPVSVMAFRAQAGAANPTDIFLPSVLGTGISAFAAVVLVCLKQGIVFWRGILLWGLLGWAGFMGATLLGFSQLEPAQTEAVMKGVSGIVIMGLVAFMLFAAMKAKVQAYTAFIDGAKDAFETAIQIVPFVVAMLVAIGVFRASGALDYVLDAVRWTVTFLGMDAAFVDALPVGLLKPFSGSGARGLMLDVMQHQGADSFAGRMACSIQGGTETTFYTLAVYYGAVKVSKTRYTAGIGLLVDAIGVVSAILLAYLFFG